MPLHAPLPPYLKWQYCLDNEKDTRLKVGQVPFNGGGPLNHNSLYVTAGNQQVSVSLVVIQIVVVMGLHLVKKQMMHQLVIIMNRL